MVNPTDTAGEKEEVPDGEMGVLLAQGPSMLLSQARREEDLIRYEQLALKFIPFAGRGSLNRHLAVVTRIAESTLRRDTTFWMDTD